MLCDSTFLSFSVMFNLVQVVWPLAKLCCVRACAVTQYFPANKDCTSWAYLSLSSQQQLRVNLDIQTIDTENDVLSVRPLQEAHFEEINEQQKSEQSLMFQSWS